MMGGGKAIQKIGQKQSEREKILKKQDEKQNEEEKQLHIHVLYCTILQLSIALFKLIAGPIVLGSGTGFWEFNYAGKDRDY